MATTIFLSADMPQMVIQWNNETEICKVRERYRICCHQWCNCPHDEAFSTKPGHYIL